MRLTAAAPLVVAALLAVVPADAVGKEIHGGRVCGAAGCRATGGLPVEATALTPPGVDVPDLQPWYRIDLRMGDGQRVLQSVRVLWAPRERLVARDEKDPRWFAASPAAARIARRLTRGMKPFPAGTMPLRLPPPRIADVVGPARHDTGDGAPWAPGGAAAAVALAAGLGGRRYRSRRAKARTARAPRSAT
jgi:hypothetical protein